MPQPGDQITPSLQLVRELGSGGMGTVWVADHSALQTQVVVKFMHAQFAGDRDSLLRFSREAAAGAKVKSPHVVQVHDHGIAPDGAPFIVMELLEGSDLASHCEAHGPMSLVDVDHVVSQTCKALSRAHERGIVHRDIKPQNIFLTNVGDAEVFVKVLDFGIAKASESRQGVTTATKTGAVMGTPYYMSPEQIVGAKGVDFRSDLWALGVVTFECLTGRKPFEGETKGGLAVAICSHPMPVPSRVNPALPAQFDEWFARACGREPEQRFASAKEMGDGLHALVTGRRAGDRGSNAPGPSSSATVAPTETRQKDGPRSKETDRPQTLRVTTLTPARDADTAAFLPKRLGKRAGLIVVAAVSLSAIAALGIHVAHRSPGEPSGSSAQTIKPASPVEPIAPPTPDDIPSGSASVARDSAGAEHAWPSPAPSASASGSPTAGIGPNTSHPSSTEDPAKNALATHNAGVRRTPAEEPAPRVAPPAPPAAAAQSEQSFLNINSIPASRVVLDGLPIGSTPKLGYPVSPGPHSVVFVNPDLDFRRQISVTVAPGETKAALVRN